MIQTQVFIYCMHILVIVHVHSMFVNEKFSSNMNATFTNLKLFGGVNDKTRDMAQRLLASIITKVARDTRVSQRRNFPFFVEDVLPVPWANLKALWEIVDNFVFRTHTWCNQPEIEPNENQDEAVDHAEEVASTVDMTGDESGAGAFPTSSFNIHRTDPSVKKVGSSLKRIRKIKDNENEVEELKLQRNVSDPSIRHAGSLEEEKAESSGLEKSTKLQEEAQQHQSQHQQKRKRRKSGLQWNRQTDVLAELMDARAKRSEANTREQHYSTVLTRKSANTKAPTTPLEKQM